MIIIQFYSQFRDGTTRSFSEANVAPKVVQCIMFQVGVIPDKNEIGGEKEVWACRHIDNGELYSLEDLPEDFFELHDVVSGVTRLTITYAKDGPIFEIEVIPDVPSLAPSTEPTLPPSTSPSGVPTPTPSQETPSPTREADANFTFNDGSFNGTDAPTPSVTANDTFTYDPIQDENFTLFPTDTDDSFEFNAIAITDDPTLLPSVGPSTESAVGPLNTFLQRTIDIVGSGGEDDDDIEDNNMASIDIPDTAHPPTEPKVIV